MPTGSFDAIRIDVLMVLDDATAIRNGTTCKFIYWYSPAVRETAHERRATLFTTTLSPTATGVQSATYELASFTLGN